ncbi:MAG TPA: Tex family protein [Candidatus Atribacteria bacterium]|nr:Tex family protein [Candidatus Atribacteria bacterium]
MDKITNQLAREFNISVKQVANTLSLVDEGCTIPFIARYRKEATGGLDDALLRDLNERLVYLRNLEAHREDIYRLIDEQGKMTEELKAEIEKAQTITELDDIYRPYRPKRRTKATIAKEKGLLPLAEVMWAQETTEEDVLTLAADFINPEADVNSAEDAIAYALDIIAEMISDDAQIRKYIREYTYRHGFIETKAAVDEPSVYDMYYDFSEAVNKIVPHRILAINRGERDKFLNVKISLDVEKLMGLLSRKVIAAQSKCPVFIQKALEDSYKRLIAPSIEREIRNMLTEKAEEQAIKVFGENLRNLLLQPPVRGCVVMGMDPAYRTGNKIAVVDETGKVLDTAVVYITLPNHDIEKGKEVIKGLIGKHKVRVIALGNGTASRESEMVVAQVCKELDGSVQYIIVNEAGASVYSASRLGTEEFPEYDVALRSAVSIARRLQDPLAELVKIDPKSIGVGQYQHDVNQKRLAETLQGVVEYCVNNVGVELNTASVSLLQYVSGISPSIAKNIVAYRETRGRFTSREQLLEVKMLGPKAFEQSAGFLRISDGDNILDNTGVHPESYDAVFRLFEVKGWAITDIGSESMRIKLDEVSKSKLDELAGSLGIGLPTLKDILNELKKPGRDPRDELPKPVLRSDVLELKDLKPDMLLTGTVRNVTDFGVFVDIGVHQDGLVHISNLSEKYVKHPMEVVQVGDIVKVRVLDVDVERKRISLSMKDIR